MDHRYDVALSFSQKDKNIAKNIADELKMHGMRVFFDNSSSDELLGRELYKHLTTIYKKVKICIILLSNNYISSQWANTEYNILKSNAIRKKYFSIFPIKIDSSEIPTEFKSVTYINLDEVSLEHIAELIKKNTSQIIDPPVINRSQYHVNRRENGWVVRKRGAARALKITKSQDDAIKVARLIAENKKNNEIIIHNQDGSIKNRIKVETNNG